MLGRVIQGVGSAASWIAALAIVSDFARPGRRGEAIGCRPCCDGGRRNRRARTGWGHCRPDLVCRPLPDRLRHLRRSRHRGRGRAPSGTTRRTPQTPAWATIRRPIGSGTGAVATAMTLAAACALGLIEVVAPLDLDSRLDLSSAVIGLLFAWSIAVDAVVAPLGGRWGIGGAGAAPRPPASSTAARRCCSRDSAGAWARRWRSECSARDSASRSPPQSRGSTRLSARRTRAWLRGAELLYATGYIDRPAPRWRLARGCECQCGLRADGGRARGVRPRRAPPGAGAHRPGRPNATLSYQGRFLDSFGPAWP